MSTSYATTPANAKVKPEPYTINISEDRLSKLKQLVQLSDLPPENFESQHDDFKYGLPRSWLKEAKQQWETQFDWREQEQYWNTFPHFTMPVEQKGNEFTIHFVALFSEKPDAIPIIMSHGWPGCFIEFLGLMQILKDRYKPSELPYHIIVPSLPGWAFSSPPPLNRNFEVQDVAEIFNTLMVNLGFGQGYIAQGGDIGSYVSRMLGVFHEECKAVHVNFCIVPEPEGAKVEDLTEQEQHGIVRTREFLTFGTAYALEHATRPSTIGLALSTSPVAFLAWIGEKFHIWSDVTPSNTEIISTASLYWLTQSIGTSIYTYRQVTPPPAHPSPQHSGDIAARKLPERADGSEQKTKDAHLPEWYLRKPMGYSRFHAELAPTPVAWVKTTGHLVWFKRHDKGGHFAALEQPELLLGDVEDFVSQVWK